MVYLYPIIVECFGKVSLQPPMHLKRYCNLGMEHGHLLYIQTDFLYRNNFIIVDLYFSELSYQWIKQQEAFSIEELMSKCSPSILIITLCLFVLSQR